MNQMTQVLRHLYVNTKLTFLKRVDPLLWKHITEFKNPELQEQTTYLV